MLWPFAGVPNLRRPLEYIHDIHIYILDICGTPLSYSELQFLQIIKTLIFSFWDIWSGFATLFIDQYLFISGNFVINCLLLGGLGYDLSKFLKISFCFFENSILFFILKLDWTKFSMNSLLYMLS